MDFFEQNLRIFTTLVNSIFPKIQKRVEEQKSIEFYVSDQFISGLTRNSKDYTLYLMPIYCHKEIGKKFSEKIISWRSGKSCLKFSEKKPLDWSLIESILVESNQFYC